MTTRAYFDFHFCFQEPHSADVIGFDVYFNWQELLPPDSDRKFRRGESELVLKAEADFVRSLDAMELEPIFNLRYRSKNGSRFVVRRGRDRQRFPLISSGSGGNWYWEVLRTTTARTPHVMNWLRRLKGCDVTEWNSRFRETLWNHRGSIQHADLLAFRREWIRESLKREKEEFQVRVHSRPSVVEKERNGS